MSRLVILQNDVTSTRSDSETKSIQVCLYQIYPKPFVHVNTVVALENMCDPNEAVCLSPALFADCFCLFASTLGKCHFTC